jgi:hypothetical protein
VLLTCTLINSIEQIMASKHEREPIKHTCPDIDKVIKSLDKVMSYCKLSGREEEVDFKSIIDDIQYELWGLTDKLEDLRSSNDILRSWGIEEAERVDELEMMISEQAPEVCDATTAI